MALFCLCKLTNVLTLSVISNQLNSKVFTPPPVCDVNKDSPILLNQQGSN